LFDEAFDARPSWKMSPSDDAGRETALDANPENFLLSPLFWRFGVLAVQSQGADLGVHVFDSRREA
jgi:hypothetical protein